MLKSLLSFLSTALSQGSCVQSGFFPSVDHAEPTSTLFMASSFTTSIAFGAFDALLQPQASGVDENWSDSVGDSSADLPLTEDSFACGGVAECWEICDLNRLETSSYSTGDQAAESSRGIRLGTAYIVVSHIFAIQSSWDLSAVAFAAYSASYFNSYFSGLCAGGIFTELDSTGN